MDNIRDNAYIKHIAEHKDRKYIFHRGYKKNIHKHGLAEWKFKAGDEREYEKHRKKNDGVQKYELYIAADQACPIKEQRIELHRKGIPQEQPQKSEYNGGYCRKKFSSCRKKGVCFSEQSVSFL